MENKIYNAIEKLQEMKRSNNTILSVYYECMSNYLEIGISRESMLSSVSYIDGKKLLNRNKAIDHALDILFKRLR